MAIRLFKHYWQLPLAVLALIETVLLTAGPMFAAWVLSQSAGTEASSSLSRPHPGLIALFVLINFLLMVAMGLYHARQRSGMLGLVMRVALAFGLGWGLLACFNLMLVQPRFGPNVLTLASLFAGVAVICVRLAFEKLVDEEWFKRRVVVFGAGRRAASIAQLRRRTDRRGFHILGYVAAEADTGEAVPLSERLPAELDLTQYCREHLVDEIIVAMDDRRRSFPMDQLLVCRLDGVEITELVSFLERETGKIRLDVLNPSWMIFSDGFRRGRIHVLLERLCDVLASVALLSITAPVMLLTMLAIKLEDGWSAPMFYGQVRVGQRGQPFRVLKFRSMRTDAESGGRAVWATPNDNRVTRVGSFIRKTRIDELPQIINVLRGEMSFVGPRPERPEFAAQLEERIPYYRERHTLKPGITGWAQLCYPYGSSEQDAVEKLQYDLFYVKNHTLMFYFAIVLQTVEVVLWRKGSR